MSTPEAQHRPAEEGHLALTPQELLDPGNFRLATEAEVPHMNVQYDQTFISDERLRRALAGSREAIGELRNGGTLRPRTQGAWDADLLYCYRNGIVMVCTPPTLGIVAFYSILTNREEILKRALAYGLSPDITDERDLPTQLPDGTTIEWSNRELAITVCKKLADGHLYIPGMLAVSGDGNQQKGIGSVLKGEAYKAIDDPEAWTVTMYYKLHIDTPTGDEIATNQPSQAANNSYEAQQIATIRPVGTFEGRDLPPGIRDEWIVVVSKRRDVLNDLEDVRRRNMKRMGADRPKRRLWSRRSLLKLGVDMTVATAIYGTMLHTEKPAVETDMERVLRALFPQVSFQKWDQRAFEALGGDLDAQQEFARGRYILLTSEKSEKHVVVFPGEMNFPCSIAIRDRLALAHFRDPEGIITYAVLDWSSGKIGVQFYPVKEQVFSFLKNGTLVDKSPANPDLLRRIREDHRLLALCEAPATLRERAAIETELSSHKKLFEHFPPPEHVWSHMNGNVGKNRLYKDLLKRADADDMIPE